MRYSRILFALFFISSFVCLESSHAVEWKESLDGVFEQSKESNKPVLVFVYHPLALKASIPVWENPLVTKTAASFIPARLDINRGADFVNKYRITHFPSVLFFDPQGREIIALRLEDNDMKEDFLQRTVLFQRMKDVLADIEKFSLVEKQIQSKADNPQLVALYAKGLRNRGEFDKAEEQYVRLMNWSNLDPKIKQEAHNDYVVMYLLKASVDFYASQFDKSINTLRRFIQKYPKDDAIPQANYLLGMSYYEAGDKREGERILRDLIKDKKTNPVIQQNAKNFLEQKKGGK